jgi:predicted amidohydrolase
MPETTRIAAVQMDVRLAAVNHNLACVLERLGTATNHGARLVVFPECALTGYGFADADKARAAACAGQEAVEVIGERCRALGVTAVVGTLLPGRKTVVNAAVTFLPDGGAHVYHKTHLPFLGVDKVVERGDRLDVVETPVGNLGTIICYDLRFPEAARTLALEGADIIAMPTNWPEGSDASSDFFTRTRAAENRVFLVVANRVGTESGFTFIGRSQICDIEGNRIAEADRVDEVILYADIDPSAARQKRMVVVPGEYEMDFIADRCPEAYGMIEGR